MTDNKKTDWNEAAQNILRRSVKEASSQFTRALEYLTAPKNNGAALTNIGVGLAGGAAALMAPIVVAGEIFSQSTAATLAECWGGINIATLGFPVLAGGLASIVVTQAMLSSCAGAFGAIKGSALGVYEAVRPEPVKIGKPNAPKAGPR